MDKLERARFRQMGQTSIRELPTKREALDGRQPGKLGQSGVGDSITA
jgi:hypothetical protein